jgi:hypothetical protein
MPLLPPAPELGPLLSAIAAGDFIVGLGSFAATPAHQAIEGGKIRASGPKGRSIGFARQMPLLPPAPALLECTPKVRHKNRENSPREGRMSTRKRRLHLKQSSPQVSVNPCKGGGAIWKLL